MLAADVDNPLTGPRGAAAVFGPQKGASPQDVTELDAALGTFRDRLTVALGEPARAAADAPGAGAAGGVGYAALAVLGAERRPGVDVVLDLVDLDAAVAGADLLVTGEGSLDEQSLGGKTPLGVLRVGRRHGVPVIAVCGRTTLSPEALAEAGFAAVHELRALARTRTPPCARPRACCVRWVTAYARSSTRTPTHFCRITGTPHRKDHRHERLTPARFPQALARRRRGPGQRAAAARGRGRHGPRPERRAGHGGRAREGGAGGVVPERDESPRRLRSITRTSRRPPRTAPNGVVSVPRRSRWPPRSTVRSTCAN